MEDEGRGTSRALFCCCEDMTLSRTGPMRVAMAKRLVQPGVWVS
jgi:hypothetical protein